MSPYAAKDAIRFLEKEIVGEIEQSEAGRRARELANLSGPAHISAMVVSQEEDPPSEDSVSFRAFIEVHDAEDNQYEAEIVGTCEKLKSDGAGWRTISLKIVDAGPLPKGG